MSNIRKDLKKFGANPGLATPKNPEAIAALTEDVKYGLRLMQTVLLGMETSFSKQELLSSKFI